MQHVSNSWERRRNSFNHDWLKNQFLVRLNKALNLLDDRIEDPEFEQRFVSDLLDQWQKHNNEPVAMIDDFMSEMSPRSLFAFPSLSRCDTETRQWLGDLVNILWIAREPVENWLNSIKENSTKADDAYHELEKTLETSCDDIHSAISLRPYIQYFINWRDRSQELGEAISRLPHTVKVV